MNKLSSSSSKQKGRFCRESLSWGWNSNSRGQPLQLLRKWHEVYLTIYNKGYLSASSLRNFKQNLIKQSTKSLPRLSRFPPQVCKPLEQVSSVLDPLHLHLLLLKQVYHSIAIQDPSYQEFEGRGRLHTNTLLFNMKEPHIFFV